MASMVTGDEAAIPGALAVTATVSDLLADLLVEREVVAVFELTGGMITRLLDAIHRLGGPQSCPCTTSRVLGLPPGARGG